MKGVGSMKRGHAAAVFPALLLMGSMLLVALLISGCGSAAESDAVPTTEPESQFVTFDVSLNEYRGKPLVLAFMASW